MPSTLMVDSWRVRPYCPSDRSAVFQLCGDTAFFGDPLERFIDARELFLDAFASYYTDLAGDHLWVVAGDHGEILGYLMGCTDTLAYSDWFRRHLRRIMWRLITLRYRGWLTRKTIGYAWRYFQMRVPYVDLSPYPAHFHIAIRSGWRGHGMGAALMQTYLDQLRNENIPGVHLETTSENRIAVPWYERLGFRLLQRVPSDLYEASLGHSVDLLMYGMRL